MSASAVNPASRAAASNVPVPPQQVSTPSSFNTTTDAGQQRNTSFTVHNAESSVGDRWGIEQAHMGSDMISDGVMGIFERKTVPVADYLV